MEEGVWGWEWVEGRGLGGLQAHGAPLGHAQGGSPGAVRQIAVAVLSALFLAPAPVAPLTLLAEYVGDFLNFRRKLLFPVSHPPGGRLGIPKCSSAAQTVPYNMLRQPAFPPERGRSQKYRAYRKKYRFLCHVADQASQGSHRFVREKKVCLA